MVIIHASSKLPRRAKKAKRTKRHAKVGAVEDIGTLAPGDSKRGQGVSLDCYATPCTKTWAAESQGNLGVWAEDEDEEVWARGPGKVWAKESGHAWHAWRGVVCTAYTSTIPGYLSFIRGYWAMEGGLGKCGDREVEGTPPV